jgi:RNA polymerase sigma-70 factor (ECF subfamily)
MADNRDGVGLDQAQLERLYVKLEGPIYNVVYRWVWSREEAHDITQEAFVRVWNVRERVNVETAPAFLYKTALNMASNRRRSRRLWGWLGLESAGDPADAGRSAEQALDSARAAERVRAAVDALPESLRRVIVLSEYSELSYTEIGAVLGVPAGTVGSRRNAALKQLAAALGGLEDSSS